MIKLINECDVKGFVAVIPSVCVGNVGQLASDLLISSFELKKFGYVWHSSILTFAGADNFGDPRKLSTACEIFYSGSLKLLVFQIRTGFFGTTHSLVKELSEWLRDNEVKQVIILGGIDAQERRDGQLVGTPLRCVFCPLTQKMGTKRANDSNWLELESEELKHCSSRDGTITHIPGSGIAVTMFNKLVKDKVPCLMLLEFCYEGPNEPDAMNLADYASDWINIKEALKGERWIIPPSWSFFYGPQPPAQIFN